MQPKVKNPRLLHVGKSKQELAAYQKFLREEFLLEKTEERKTSLGTTSDSTFEEEDKLIEPKNVTPKNWTLKLTDFFKSNLVITIVATIIGSIIFALAWGYYILLSDQNTQKNRIADIKLTVDNLDKKYDAVTTLDKNISVFKAEVERDIEFIKYKLSQVNK
jgi:hypothetical protein